MFTVEEMSVVRIDNKHMEGGYHSVSSQQALHISSLIQENVD